MRALCVPSSRTCPRCTTAILSELRIVVRRWAMVMVVRPRPVSFFCSLMISSSAACTMRSLSLSSALVASSRSRTAGLRTSARAIATRCFCPPESLLPPWPTCVP
mmetsp:Transcript_25318/g.55351  ORF Transcript_25318/g.55351 Transcript_25318/m.55351 type:complete len:105 (+) Transcript_25318:1049-1363(+)